jgi:membrane protein required for colicin V production
MPTPPPLSLSQLSSFDWLLLIMVLVSVALAFRRGIIKVLFSLAGLITGIVLASWNYGRLAATLHRWVSSEAAAQVIAFLAILIGVTILFSLAAALLRKTVAAVGLGFADRLLGAGFGLLRGLLLGVAVLMAVSAFVPDSGWVRKSYLAPYFLAGAHAVSFVVPRGFEEQMAAGTSHLLQQTPEQIRPRVSPQRF